ncbi:hypothetical protein J0A67_14465 [Algoriphagus aestuariicola]|uniref:Lipoprotein n=1 Tax=Algoriphagus aestuariicola TaxID=1852016 RepID=A0ABS3BS17_9BACT|nr:hypothetical protein [Algoriphagus aestuariicola]MBN7802074.1 hypothetical protein [Algoriphagus aestuariicola]
MKNAFLIFPVLLLSFIFYSCQENEEPENLLEQVGFEGTLPDGSTFGTSEIRSGNGTGGSGVNGKNEGRHILDIRTVDHKWSIGLETPSQPLPDGMPRGEQVPFQEIVDLFNTHYPYEDLLQVFLTEKSKADADPEYTSFEQFRVQVANQEKYYSYLTEYFFPRKGGKIRVLAVEEGLVKNLSGLDVRKIEVVLEFDLPMKTMDPTVAIQEGNLKGLGRFRYREDFYQGELEEFD